MIARVAAVLADLRSHPRVRCEVNGVEVNGVEVAGAAVEIVVTLHYATATPVCCSQASCYVRFLGRARMQVPDAIERALGVYHPEVTVRARLVHEPGFRYIDHKSGTLLDAGVDHEQVYEPSHFRE